MLENLYPNTLYHVWVAAKSRRGEGAATPRLPVRTEQYGEYREGEDVVTLDFQRKYLWERCKIFITFLALVLKYFPNV